MVEWTIILCVSVSIKLELDVCSVPDTLHCFCLAAPNTFLFYCYLQARKIKNRNARELKFFQTTARQKVFLFKYMYILKIICIFIYNRFWYWKVVFTLLNFFIKILLLNKLPLSCATCGCRDLWIMVDYPKSFLERPSHESFFLWTCKPTKSNTFCLIADDLSLHFRPESIHKEKLLFLICHHAYRDTKNEFCDLEKFVE